LDVVLIVLGRKPVINGGLLLVALGGCWFAAQAESMQRDHRRTTLFQGAPAQMPQAGHWRWSLNLTRAATRTRRWR